MNPNKYSLTFACYNSVAYTKLCIESMLQHGTPLDRVVVIDNGSTDETRDYLNTLPLGGRIFNTQNLGCGVAWNQGALAQQAEWTIIMNNDVLVSPHWIEKLIGTAEQLQLKVISPALIEGSLDYDFDAFETHASQEMGQVHRIGGRHAVCLAIHQSVWLDVGYFQPAPKLLGYEDTLFFHELDKSRIQTAMTGASWLHHYGSITQTAMKQERGLAQKDGLGYRYNYKLLNQSWLTRKLNKIRRKKQLSAWRDLEVSQHNMSIHGLREKQHLQVDLTMHNTSSSAVIFFGYWSGVLPEVTELHFRSFIHHHPDSSYDLWLDSDTQSSIHPKLKWLEERPQIKIRHFSLQALIDQYVSPKQTTHYREKPWHDWLRKQHKRKVFRWINLQSWMHPSIGVTYKHSSPLFKGFLQNLAYRGDLARCLIPLHEYQQPSLYVDLDICFLSNLLDLCQDQGFAYRWEEFSFANSAVLFTPHKKAAKAIVDQGNAIETFIPWHLFTDETCQRLNIHIYPTNLFDPGWDKTSLLRDDVGLFFRQSTQSREIVQELLDKSYRVNHWHNHWQTVPEKGSPYQQLLEQFKNS